MLQAQRGATHTNRLSAKNVVRFWSQVNKADNDSCWGWAGYIGSRGYGKIYWNSKHDLAHRVSWEIHTGEYPNGMIVCHKCDTPACVNPNHLAVGSQADNINDKVRKNRQAKGEGHGMSKLNEFQIRVMRRLIEFETLPLAWIGRVFGVSDTSVRYVRSRRLWKHL